MNTEQKIKEAFEAYRVTLEYEEDISFFVFRAGYLALLNSLEQVSIDKLKQHYCCMLDNLGDTPIPSFEEWAENQYKIGSEILDENNFFR